MSDLKRKKDIRLLCYTCVWVCGCVACCVLLFSNVIRTYKAWFRSVGCRAYGHDTLSGALNLFFCIPWDLFSCVNSVTSIIDRYHDFPWTIIAIKEHTSRPERMITFSAPILSHIIIRFQSFLARCPNGSFSTRKNTYFSP